MKLLLNSADKIKDFVNDITPYDIPVELASAKYGECQIHYGNIKS